MSHLQDTCQCWIVFPTLILFSLILLKNKYSMNLTVYVHEAYLNCLTEHGKLPKNLPFSSAVGVYLMFG
jgi:hypothetical protein